MDFGMPTLIELPNLEDCADLCKRLGLQFIELNMNFPQYQPEMIELVRFQKVAEQYGLYFTIHLEENLNVSDFNHRVAKAYLDTVMDTIALAKRLQAPVINMHLAQGIYFTLPDKKVYLFSEYEDRYLESILKFRDMVTEEIGDSGIRLCVENCGGYSEVQVKALDLLLTSPVFALTFDIGHNHTTGGKDEPIIMKRRDRLCHMHIHDARGNNNHLSLGDGELDLAWYFKLAGEQNCRVVLETKTIAGLTKSVDWLSKNKA